METLAERLARLEARFEGLEEKVDRNHSEANEWRNGVSRTLELINKRLSIFDGLVNQAKGVRWLAALLFTGMIGALAFVAHEVISWLGSFVVFWSR